MTLINMTLIKRHSVVDSTPLFNSTLYEYSCWVAHIEIRRAALAVCVCVTQWLCVCVCVAVWQCA
jgi:hypothetical protein